MSFKLARLAQEKGFDELTHFCFDSEEKSLSYSGYSIMKGYHRNSKVNFIDNHSEEFKEAKVICTRPTYASLKRFLRITHNIDVEITSFRRRAADTVKYSYWVNGIEGNWLYSLTKPVYFNSYEDAMEKALERALDEINLVEKQASVSVFEQLEVGKEYKKESFELGIEVLEDAFDHIKNEIDYPELGFVSFKLGAEWQEKRMYSEEEVMSMFDKLSMHLPLHYELLVKEQFKKR